MALKNAAYLRMPSSPFVLSMVEATCGDPRPEPVLAQRVRVRGHRVPHVKQQMDDAHQHIVAEAADWVPGPADGRCRDVLRRTTEKI